MTPNESFSTTITAARAGDADALEQLFCTYYPAVERMAHRALRDERGYAGTRLVALFSTGDVVQDVCWNVLRSLSSFQGQTAGEFIKYVTATVRTRLLDMLRFHMAVRRDWRATEDVDGDRNADSARSPDCQLGTEEEVHAYFSVLADVPSRERALLTRRLEDAESFQTLATELGYPSADAARKAFYRAHARLLVALRTCGVQPDEICG